MIAHEFSFLNRFTTISKGSNCTRMWRNSTSRATAFLSRNSGSLFKFLCEKPSCRLVAGMRLDGPMIQVDDVLYSEDVDVVFENCITRTFSPALTLEEGLGKIKEAIQMLKREPPDCSSGFLRFQVAVPPSPKALCWFFSQPESFGVFPLIFLSKDIDNGTCKPLVVNGSHGVFGIGAALSFTKSSLLNTGKGSLVKRYISSDSSLILAYGCVDIYYDKESTSVSHEDGSFYFFIPQIELDEQGSISVLTATLAWDDSSHSTFKEALRSLELSLNQVICHIWHTSDTWKTKCIRSGLRKLNLREHVCFPMLYMKTVAPGGREHMDDIRELVSSFS